MMRTKCLNGIVLTVIMNNVSWEILDFMLISQWSKHLALRCTRGATAAAHSVLALMILAEEVIRNGVSIVYN